MFKTIPIIKRNLKKLVTKTEILTKYSNIISNYTYDFFIFSILS